MSVDSAIIYLLSECGLGQLLLPLQLLLLLHAERVLRPLALDVLQSGCETSESVKDGQKHTPPPRFC